MLSVLWIVSVLCLGTKITTITPTFFNCIFIKPGKYHDVRKIKKYYKETKLTASKENIVTTLGCKAQIYMWKKKQAVQMFLLFSPSPAHRREAGRNAPEMDAPFRFACSVFFLWVWTQIPVLLLQPLLLYLQHATVSLDGTGKPATNQDKCYWLTQNHSADWGMEGEGCSLEEWKGETQEVFFMIGLKQWKFWSMKVKVPVWHSLNKYLLLFTEVTYISSCGSHWAHSKT